MSCQIWAKQVKITVYPFLPHLIDLIDLNDLFISRLRHFFFHSKLDSMSLHFDAWACWVWVSWNLARKLTDSPHLSYLLDLGPYQAEVFKSNRMRLQTNHFIESGFEVNLFEYFWGHYSLSTSFKSSFEHFLKNHSTSLLVKPSFQQLAIFNLSGSLRCRFSLTFSYLRLPTVCTWDFFLSSGTWCSQISISTSLAIYQTIAFSLSKDFRHRSHC